MRANFCKGKRRLIILRGVKCKAHIKEMFTCNNELWISAAKVFCGAITITEFIASYSLKIFKNSSHQFILLYKKIYKFKIWVWIRFKVLKNIIVTYSTRIKTILHLHECMYISVLKKDCDITSQSSSEDHNTEWFIVFVVEHQLLS